LSLFVCLTEIEIGFERPSYTVSEPGASVQTQLMVCIIVSRGSVGQELIIVPDFREGTASCKLD